MLSQHESQTKLTCKENLLQFYWWFTTKLVQMDASPLRTMKSVRQIQTGLQGLCPTLWFSLSKALRQHNTKQQCKGLQKGMMKRNGLSLPMMPPKWEPETKPRTKLRIVKELNTVEQTLHWLTMSCHGLNKPPAARQKGPLGTALGWRLGSMTEGHTNQASVASPQ